VIGFSPSHLPGGIPEITFIRMRREKGTFDMKFDIVRAWKDETYRQQLSSEEQALLPANPAGELELSDAELLAIHGAHGGTEFEATGDCFQTIGDSSTCVTNGNVVSGCKAPDEGIHTLDVAGFIKCA